jgi:glycosyltransferase involved in cell wall biosynthesis
MLYGESPLITVGVVVRNREWIIGKMLNALLSQTYPHDKIYVLIVDGNSSDKTVEIAEKILEKGDFKGYKIIVKECSIPEGRNLCIDNMQGDALLSWDSDVIMDSDAVSLMVKAMIENKADIVDVKCVEIFVNSIEDAEVKIKQAKSMQNQSGAAIHVVSATGMGHTLVAKAVFNNLRFDPDLTVCEDLDFSYRAGKKGYKMIALGHVLTFDVNMWKKGYSDTHIDMPLKYAVRGIRKKAEIQVLTYNTKITAKVTISFFLKNKRYLFYLGYAPAVFLTICGLFLYMPLTLAFPSYLLAFAIWQIRKRGFTRGLQSTLRSILIGVPYASWLVFYSIKNAWSDAK